MELTIGIQNKETTEAGTLIITMNPVNTAKWIATPELIEAEIAVQSYGVISIPNYEDLDASSLMCYVSLDFVTYKAALADIIAGAIGDVITFTASGTGGGGANDAEITKMFEGQPFSLYDSTASLIGSSAFYSFSNNTKLAGIEATAVEQVGEYAFASNTCLETVSLPNASVIGSYAFASCTSLTTAYVPKATSFGSYAFSNCNKLENLTLASILTSMASGVFRHTAIKSISFEYSGAIPNYAFANCEKLEYVKIDKTTGLNQGAFQSCYSLSTAVFDNMRSFGQSAFAKCSGLMSLYNYAVSSSAPFCNNLTFDGTPMLDSTLTGSFGSIYVPSEMVSLYIASTAWSSFVDRFVSITE